MRAPQLVSDFLEWRWAPCVGLTAGSLAFVALALLLIPTQFDAAPSTPSSDSLASLDRPSAPAAPRTLFGASLARGATGFAQRTSDEGSPRRPPPPNNDPGAVAPQRGFSPILDRPAPPPAAEPPPPEPPPPAPGAVIISQPEPGGPSREMPAQ